MKLRDGRLFTDPKAHISRQQAWINREHYKKAEAVERQKEPKREFTGLRSGLRYGFLTKKEALAYPNLPEKLIAWIKRRKDVVKG